MGRKAGTDARMLADWPSLCHLYRLWTANWGMSALAGEVDMQSGIGKLSAALLIVVAWGGGTANAGDMMSSSLVACPSDGTMVGGINSCGKIWALESGQ